MKNKTYQVWASSNTSDEIPDDAENIAYKEDICLHKSCP